MLIISVYLSGTAMYRNLLIIIVLLAGISASSQSRVFGKITNAKMEPLAFASVQVKEYQHGTVSKEDGSYELKLEEGKYDLVISIVGHKVQVLTIIVRKADYEQNVIMETADANTLAEVTVEEKQKTRLKNISAM